MHNKVPKHVVQVFVDMRLTHCGVPEIVVLDTGGEFEFASLGVMQGDNKDWWKDTVAC